MANSLEKFFKEGNYKTETKIYPSCNLPKGGTFYSFMKINNVNNCETCKFIGKTLIHDDKEFNYFSQHFYYKNGHVSGANSLGSSHEGKYKIKGNILKCNVYGYSHPIGKNIFKKCIIKKCKNLYSLSFYRKHENKWIQYGESSLCKIND